MALAEIALITIAALMIVMAFTLLVAYVMITNDEDRVYPRGVYALSLVIIYISMIIIYMFIYLLLLR